MLSQAYWQEVAGAVLTGQLSSEAVRLESWRRALERCGCDDAGIAREALDAYARHRLATYALFDDAIDALRMLPAGLKVAIITNGWSFNQREKVARTGLLLHAGALVISSDLGVAKPDAAIFLRALELLGIAPDEAIHAGDSLDSDVQGARNAGLRAAVWLNRHGTTRRPDQPAPDHEIRSLRELPALLAQL